MNEIRDVTFGLWGPKLDDWQAVQRIVLGGFHDPRVATDMFAIAQGESGFYVMAWHANVLRDPPFSGEIVLDAQGRMKVRSIDLGFLQRNVEISPDLSIEPSIAAMREFVQGQFDDRPALARADLAAIDAHDLYVARGGFGPWYAYQPDTPKYKRKKLHGAKAMFEYLMRTQVGKIDDEGNPASKYPKLDLVFPS